MDNPTFNLTHSTGFSIGQKHRSHNLFSSTPMVQTLSKSKHLSKPTNPE